MRKIFLFLFILPLFLLTIRSYSQDALVISGKVVNTSTWEGVALVNIGIQGELAGTASDNEGNFTLRMPSEYQTKTLVFSAIGYQQLAIPIQKYVSESLYTIQLTPLSYDIENIDINTKSKVLYRIISDASKNVRNVFLNQPFNYNAVYQSETTDSLMQKRTRDAKVLISDATGYGSSVDAYSVVNYKIQDVQRNFDVVTLRDGTTNLDDVLSFDIARTPANILNPEYLDEFDLELIAEAVNGKDSVWIISYRLPKTDMSRTGHFFSKEYSGKITISKNTKTVVKNEINLKTAGFGKDGISSASVANNASSNYHITTSYKYWDKRIGLDSIAINQSYANENGILVQQNSSLKILSVNVENPERISKRQYYECQISDPDFWVFINGKSDVLEEVK